MWRHDGGPPIDVARLHGEDRDSASRRQQGAEGDAALDHDAEHLGLISFSEQLLAGLCRKGAAELCEARPDPRLEA